MRRFLLLTATALALSAAHAAETPAPAKPAVDKVNSKIGEFTLTGVGRTWTLTALGGAKTVVLVYLSFDCPVSNSYAPTLAALYKASAGKAIAFVGVVAGKDLSPADIAKKAKEFDIPFMVLRDDEFGLADKLKATTTPEAFVLDHNRVLRYRGRIDNAYSARLKKNAQTTEHDLADALAALGAGKDVKVPATKAIGCPLVKETVAKKDGKVTYHRDVLPILQENCQSCHRAGEVGPFALMTYKQAANWASDIRDYTADRRMPPWKAVDGVPFHNERRLSDRELKVLADWVSEGTPEGDPKDAPAPKVFTEGWQLGKPDLILTMPEEFTLGPAGKDVFRCVVLPTGLNEDKHVVAVEVRPGNAKIVHHSLNFFDTSGEARKLEAAEKARKKAADEQDRGPGYGVGMGVGFTPKAPGTFGGVGGWAPGQRPRFLPDGYGYPLPKNSDFVVQLHYHRNGRTEKDKTQVGLYFAKKPGIKPYKNAVIPGRFLFVPAGSEKHTVTGGITVESDGELHSVMPHMHMIGRKIKITEIPPGGQPKVLLDIRDWDYNWQETYFLKKPTKFVKGTRFEVEAVYDNSAKNPHNPFSPPRLIRFGDQTDNEMCFVFLGVTNDAPGRFPFKADALGATPKR